MRPTTHARLCVVVLALLSVGLGGMNDRDAANSAGMTARMPAVLMARAQPMAGPRCKNQFPQKPLCKFVDDLAASPLTFLDASAGETIKLGAYDTHIPTVIPFPRSHALPPPFTLPPFLSPPHPPGPRNEQKFHRDLPDTKVYAYGVSRDSARYPGPVLVAKRGITTKCGKSHSRTAESGDLSVHLFLKLLVTTSVHIYVITAVHKHGGETSSKSDGHPMAWYTAFGEQGPEFESEVHTYPNMQRPTMLWYHDHTLGITALNTAAGMVGLYIIRDPQGEERRLKRWLPRGERQLHLVLADRSFFPNGSINYPNQGFVPNVHPNWIPGYVGNTNVVNGKVWPFLNVRRAMHRIRMLSAANARTYNLTFQCAGRGDHNFNPPLAGPVLPFYLVRREKGS
ncbi:unnamed protein product [Closterium sp. NIES-53]